MKKTNILKLMSLLIVGFLSLQQNELKSQVVINEIFANGTVELKNNGSSTVDVSTYWLCDFPAYEVLENSNIICGNLMLDPGGILVVDDFNYVDPADGEMGLYTSPDFGAATSMIDYVEWGSNGHTRASVAEIAGIWTSGDFAPAFEATQSLAYDGEGELSSDWTAGEPTICDDNVAPPTIETYIYEAPLTGTQQSPSVLTKAFGSVTATLTENQLVISGQFAGLTGDFDANIAGGAHVHLGLAGQNGGIELFLNTTVASDLKAGTFEANDNTFILTDDQVKLLKERKLYINIHTTAYPGGELRGQLLATADQYLHSVLTGSNQVPSIYTPAYGNIAFELRGNELIVSGSFDNLTDEVAIDLAGGAHIHDAPNGRNGGIVLLLNLTLDEDNRGATLEADNNTFTLTEEQKDKILSNSYYVNVHSLANLPGELRGQITPFAGAIFRADLAGTQQTNPVNTSANGRLILNYDGIGNITVSGTFNNLESDLNTALAGGIHIHDGQAGRNGGIVYILNTEVSEDNRSALINPADNTFPITEEQLYRLYERGFYVNVHSLDNPPGELRGQLLPLSKGYLATNLAGLNEVPSLISNGAGNLVFEVNDNQLVVSGGFTNLDGDFAAAVGGGAHLHLADAANNGGIGIFLNTTPDTDLRGGVYNAAENIFTITDGFRDSLFQNLYYVNIHSQANIPGEIRGQVLREDNAFPYHDFNILHPSNNTELDLHDESDLSINWESTTDPNNDLVVYTWQLSLNEDFAEIVLSTKVGLDTFFNTNTHYIDSLLHETGISFEENFDVYHRVLASDGSVSTSSNFFTLTVVNEEDTDECGAPNELDGFVSLGEFENSRYYLSENIERPLDAQNLAASLGGYLVTINSQEENDFIQSLAPEFVYIGLNDYKEEGSIEWFNGDPIEYNNIAPCSFCFDNIESQDFVVLAPWDGQWSFSNFYAKRLFVVEIPCDVDADNGFILTDCPSDETIILPVGTTEGTIPLIDPKASTSCVEGGLEIIQTDGPTPGELVALGSYELVFEFSDACGNRETCTVWITFEADEENECPRNIDGFTFIGSFNGNNYFVSNETEFPMYASDIAQANGGYLASINSADENEFIFNEIDIEVYIGLNDNEEEGSLVLASGEAVEYSNFDLCPFCNDNEEEFDFAIMHSWNGGWSWSNVWSKRKFVIEIPCDTYNSDSDNVVPTDNEITKTSTLSNINSLEVNKIFPNPAYHDISIDIVSSTDQAITLNIYDARGTLVLSEQKNLYNGKNTIIFDINAFSGGIYFIQIPDLNNQPILKKFIKVD